MSLTVIRYSIDPDKYRPLIEEFRLRSYEEGNNSISPKKYNPDNENLETWMVFKEDELISISVAERSHYTNDPDTAVRICRYHILKDHRFTHCGLIMAEHQIKWARENGYQIMYATHDITNKAINSLYQRRRKMTVVSFNKYTTGEWYTKLQLETKFLFKTGDMLQYVYSIRLQDDNYIWDPKSDHIIEREHDGQIK